MEFRGALLNLLHQQHARENGPLRDQVLQTLGRSAGRIHFYYRIVAYDLLESAHEFRLAARWWANKDGVAALFEVRGNGNLERAHHAGDVSLQAVHGILLVEESILPVVRQMALSVGHQIRNFSGLFAIAEVGGVREGFPIHGEHAPLLSAVHSIGCMDVADDREKLRVRRGAPLHPDIQRGFVAVVIAAQPDALVESASVEFAALHAPTHGRVTAGVDGGNDASDMTLSRGRAQGAVADLGKNDDVNGWLCGGRGVFHVWDYTATTSRSGNYCPVWASHGSPLGFP